MALQRRRPEMCSINAFMRRFGVCRSTAYRMIRDAEIEAFKLRGKVMISQASIDRLLDNSKHGGWSKDRDGAHCNG